MGNCQDVTYHDEVVFDSLNNGLDLDEIPEIGEALTDKSKSGKDRDWRGRKLKSLDLSEDFHDLHLDKVSEKVSSCAEVLEFLVSTEGRLKLNKSWFCKNKLCPLCNWRRAMKHSYQATIVVDKAVELYPTAEFLFLTLTIKNVDGSKLNDAMTHLTKSFDRLFKRVKVKKNLIGFIRATEVTYNEARDNYHPHLHVLLMVKSTYFKGTDNYISQSEWCDLWQKSAKLTYRPQVDIRKVRAKNGSSEDAKKKAILEVAKYPMKPIDSLGLIKPIRLKVVGSLYNGLFRKRQISYGGELKKIHKQLNLSAVSGTDEDDLILIRDDKDEEGVTQVKVIAAWMSSLQDYFRVV